MLKVPTVKKFFPSRVFLTRSKETDPAPYLHNSAFAGRRLYSASSNSLSQSPHFSFAATPSWPIVVGRPRSLLGIARPKPNRKCSRISLRIMQHESRHQQAKLVKNTGMAGLADFSPQW